MKSCARWLSAASKPSSRTCATLSAPPAMPTARAPRIFASCPTVAPTGPLAAATTTVSPGFGWPIWVRPA